MNSYERLFARLDGKPVDRAPNNCIIMGFGAKYIGASYKEFVTNYKVLSEVALRCKEDFDLDILSVISDPMREVEGFGADMIFPEDGVPYSKTPLLKEISDIGILKVTDPSKVRRMNDRLLAVRYLSERSQKQCAVQGWVEGAFAMANTLRNMNNMMVDIIEEPEAVEELLEICTEQSIRFALEQVKAGADIIGVGDAAASLIGPYMYEEFAFPYEKRIINAIHNAGAKVKLHICGDINKLLEMLTKTGADIIDCDWMVDFKKANVLFGESSSACGNFDPVAVLLQGSVDGIYKAVEKCLLQSSNRTIISAGCEVPRDTPHENLKAVSQALSQ